MRTWITILSLVMVVLPGQAQDLIYKFDVKDHTTYDTTCGKTTASYWGVINDSCQLTTSPTLINSSCGDTNFTNVPVEVRINQSGNLSCDDWAIVEYTCGDGTWYHLDSIQGCTSKENDLYSYNASCANGDSFQLRVRFDNDHNTEKWQIFDGNIEIFDACALMPIDLLSFSLAEEGSDLTFILSAKVGMKSRPVLEFSQEGKQFKSLGYPDAIVTEEAMTRYKWKMDKWNSQGYYRTAIHEDGQVEYSSVINYSADNQGLSLKFLGEKQLLVDGFKGMAKLFITTINGNMVEEREINLDQSDIIALPENLKGFHMATLQTAFEAKTIKVVLQ